MQFLKKFIPASLKLFYRINQRWRKDRVSGNNKLFATAFFPDPAKYTVVAIEQPVKANATAINKIHNLSLAITQLNNIIIQPGQIFSFWHLVGDPSKKNGYQKSRSIINGELEAAVGGGLCQLSGLIYFLALHAGLTITERHAHSIDIYKEEERFAPLGSDATVAYGYKDLRFINPYDFTIGLNFQLTATCLKGSITANEKLQPLSIAFEYRKLPGHTAVDTIYDTKGNRFIINSSCYGQLPGNATIL